MTLRGAGLAGLLIAALAGCGTTAVSPAAPSPSTVADGRASREPSGVVAPPSSPPPSAPAVAGGWRTIPTSATLGPAHLRDIAAFRGSLLAVGEGDDTVGRIWASPDGVSWSSIAGTLALKETVLRSIAVGDAGIVVCGWSADDAVALFSPDGLHWTRETLPGGHPGSSAMAVAWHGGRFVAVGGGGESNAAVSWASDDGRTWRPVSIVREGNGESLAGIVAGPAGFVASGGRGSHGAVWTSPDGTRWSRVDLPSSTADDQGRLRFVDGIYALLGAGGVVWLSADGRQWTRTTIAGFGAGVFDVAATPAGAVAVGRSSVEPGQPGAVAVARAGLTGWTSGPQDPVFEDGLASGLLMAPDGRTLVGVGMSGSGDSVFVLSDVAGLLSGDAGMSLAISDLHVATTGDGTIVERIQMHVTVDSLRDVRVDPTGKTAWPRFSVQQAGNHPLVDVEPGGPATFAAGSSTPFDLTFEVGAVSVGSPGPIVFASTYLPSTIGDWVLRMLLVDDAGREIDVRLPFEVTGPS